VSSSVGGVVQHVRSPCPCSGVWAINMNYLRQVIMAEYESVANKNMRMRLNLVVAQQKQCTAVSPDACAGGMSQSLTTKFAKIISNFKAQTLQSSVFTRTLPENKHTKVSVL